MEEKRRQRRTVRVKPQTFDPSNNGSLRLESVNRSSSTILVVRAMNELMIALEDWYRARRDYDKDPHRDTFPVLHQQTNGLRRAFEDAIDKRIREFIVIPEDNDGKTRNSN